MSSVFAFQVAEPIGTGPASALAQVRYDDESQTSVWQGGADAIMQARVAECSGYPAGEYDSCEAELSYCILGPVNTGLGYGYVCDYVK
jgi:hypothetical protein